MRSSARLCMEKHPSGAGDTSGFHAVQVWVARVSSRTSKPAAETRSHSRRPMLDGRPRSTRMASRTRAARSSSPMSMRNVDQSVSISEMRPPGRNTRAISATPARGSASHCRVRSDRTASNEQSGSSSARASPTEKRTRHRAASDLASASRSISLEASMPTTSPSSPRPPQGQALPRRVRSPRRGAAGHF